MIRQQFPEHGLLPLADFRRDRATPARVTPDL